MDQKRQTVNILSITNTNQTPKPKILRPRRGSRVVAPLHVRWSQYCLPSVGMFKRRKKGTGGREEGDEEDGQKCKTRRGVQQPSLLLAECVCACACVCMCMCVSFAWRRVVLLPLCGAGRFGGQIIHDSGDSWDLLNLIHHLQHHLVEQMSTLIRLLSSGSRATLGYN